ncbi:MAG: hypothetical protein NC548_10920 [Lachnospiraceae bacterium]|nr:hypothetical protein [Lachnospiraceae bacterium]
MKRGKENDGKSSRKAERRVSSSSKGRQQATVADSKSDDAKSERKQQPVAVQKSSRNSKHQKVDSAKETAVATELKAKHREKVKKERFLRERMWFSTIISKFFMDRGTIPDNIGNNVLVTNNVYITKNHITALFFITEMSEVTPMCWMSDMVEYVKDQAEGVVVDISLKGQRYYPDITPTGVGSREKSWRMTLDNPNMPKEYVRRSARCLYSLDVARSGANLYKFRTYVKVRAVDGAKLRKGCQAVSNYLSSIGAVYKRIQSNLDEHLMYVTMMSDKKPEHLKDFAPVIFSLQTLAESLPSIQGANDQKGVLMGYDNKSGYPYFIDFKATSAAKNIMIEALSGWGKSFMASYWLYPFFANGFNLAIMDIKGNEFTAITKALHGVTLSMRNTSTYYINTFRWSPDEVFDGDYNTYANERFRLSKEKMLMICDLNEKEESQAESLLEEFLQYVYTSVGALQDNRNTWKRTERLNPYVIFDAFDKYLSNEILAKYGDVAVKARERLRIYMSRNGSKSHVFRDQYNYLDVLDSPCLTFDFGILESSTNNDRVLFHIHVMDMITINDEFVSHKKRNGQWTVKLLEESQIVDDWLTRVYTREMTLRRSQNQVTVLLGNSVAALAANPLSAPMVENINILCLGSLNKSSRRYLLEEFGLKESETEILEDIQTNSAMARRFLLVNRMESESTTAVLEARVPESVSQSSLFKIVDTEE